MLTQLKKPCFQNSTLTNQLGQHWGNIVFTLCAIPHTIPPFYNKGCNTINNGRKG